MDITGHGKGYAYDMGSEADIAIFFVIGICILGWEEFLKLFGYGYST